jgi:O-antigen ligase
LNGARGPLLALGAGILAVLATRRQAALFVVAAAVVGIAVGTKLEAAALGKPSAIGSLVNASPQSHPSASAAPISSIHIRKEWIRSALGQFPDRPIFGHGVGVLVDNTPEAARMGVKGQLIYPHNDLVEAAYSLGVVGLALFAVFTVVPLAVLWRHRRRLDDPISSFCFVIFAFALVESNFSGEIGTDVLLWSTSCLVVLTL